MNKQELELKVELLKVELDKKESEDTFMRKEFAKAFNWYNYKQNMYSVGEEKTLKEPTWSEILVKLGKLLALKDFYNIEGNVSELECVVEKIEKHLEEINPTLN